MPKKPAYKIRFNPATTVKEINSTLDAIDACGGYCGIYVKQAKDAKKKGAK